MASSSMIPSSVVTFISLFHLFLHYLHLDMMVASINDPIISISFCSQVVSSHLDQPFLSYCLWLVFSYSVRFLYVICSYTLGVGSSSSLVVHSQLPECVSPLQLWLNCSLGCQILTGYGPRRLNALLTPLCTSQHLYNSHLSYLCKISSFFATLFNRSLCALLVAFPAVCHIITHI